MNKIFGLLLILFLLTCTKPVDPDGHAGTGSETGNVVGNLYYPDGSPAVGVTVQVRKKNTIADTSGLLAKPRHSVSALVTVDSAMTDSNGQFVIDTVDTGTYVIEAGDDENNLALVDSVVITDPDSSIQVTDTLKPAGSITGAIKLSEGGNPRKVAVLAYGINRFVLPDTNGVFTFDSLAEATYRLVFWTSLDDYDNLDTVAKVVSGETTDLDTLELPFTGIPTPKGLTVLYDTTIQEVALSWSTENPTLVKGYRVYRRCDTTSAYIQAKDTLITDTFFVDGLAYGLEKGESYQYVVRAVDANDNEGDNAQAVTVRVAFFVDAGLDSTYQLGDTVVMAARVDTISATAAEFRFDTNGDGTNELVSAADTVKFVYSDTGAYNAVVAILGGNGVVYTDTVVITIVPKDTVGAPSAPRGMVLSYDTLKQIVTLTWLPNLESDVTGYNVYRKHSDSDFVKINSAILSDTTFTDSTAVQDETYEYKVAAVDTNDTEGTKSSGDSVSVVSLFAVVDSIVNGNGTADGQFGYLVHSAIDSNGNFYIADTKNKWLQKIDSTGQFVLKYPSLQYPRSIAIDNIGEVLYISDSQQQLIIKFSFAGDYIRDWQPLKATGGIIYFAGKLYAALPDTGIQVYDSVGNELAFYPYQFKRHNSDNVNFCLSPNGKIFIADAENVLELDTTAGIFTPVYSITNFYQNQDPDIEFSDENTIILVTRGALQPYQSTFYFIDKTTGVQKGIWRSYEAITDITYSRNQRLLFAFTSSGKIILYQVNY